MRIPGRVSNGVVVLEGDQWLPEGAQVLVTLCGPAGVEEAKDIPLPLPIVRCQHPGSIDLTNEMIAKLLEDEVLSSGR